MEVPDYTPKAPPSIPMRLLLPSDPRLWTVSTPVSSIEGQVIPHLAEMRRIMKAHGGIGLAAPQVGINLRFCLVSDLVLINPTIVQQIYPKVESKEGCLSFPGVTFTVARYTGLEVRWMDEKGHVYKRTFRGLAARVVAHEYDHLDGRNLWPRFPMNPKLPPLLPGFGVALPPGDNRL